MDGYIFTCYHLGRSCLCRNQKLVFDIVGCSDCNYFIVGCRFLSFFMFKDPDYLRSENYQIRKQAIETLGDKDGLLPTDIAQVINIPYASPNMLINQDEEVQDEK